MYRQIDYRDLQDEIEEGKQIRWCGLSDHDTVLVQLLSNNKREIVDIDVNAVIRSWGVDHVLRNGEAVVPYDDVGYIPSKVDAFVTLRNATVLGINISGSCDPGVAHEYTTINDCTCGYDIELDMRGLERDGFPLPNVNILSVALWCTCGYKKFISVLDITDFNHIQVASQKELVSTFFNEIWSHQPLWMVGWNCYSFDNTCLLYHADTELYDHFRKVKIGSAGDVDYGYIIDTYGIYNVDPFVYMQRSAGYSKIYTDLSLYGVAKRLGTTLKTDMPDLYSIRDPSEVMDYNYNDSAVAAEVWIKSGLITEIPMLAVASCSHVYDCVRHMTSVTARCPVTTTGLMRRSAIDWSLPKPMQGYKGGMVLEPKRGLHKDVVVCDFSSMYPTVMMDCNISPESIEVMDRTPGVTHDIWFDETYIYVRMDENDVRFRYKDTSTIKSILSLLVKLRNENRKKNPNYAGTLKIVSNSIYGSVGYENSPMYSPLCSSSVTAIGRWCLMLACNTFTDNGLDVVYGDTDSCFVKSTQVTQDTFNGDVMEHAKVCLRRLHNILKSTPLKGMSMAIEDHHKSIMLIDKKMYCTLSTDGKIKFKGLSVVRRDSLGICKRTCTAICKYILESTDIHQCKRQICRYITDVIYDSINNRLSYSDVSKVAKRDQKRCYVYKDKNNNEQYEPVDTSSNIVTDYSVTYVLTSLSSSISKILEPCGLGTLYEIVESYSEF